MEQVQNDILRKRDKFIAKTTPVTPIRSQSPTNNNEVNSKVQTIKKY